MSLLSLILRFAPSAIAARMKPKPDSTEFLLKCLEQAHRENRELRNECYRLRYPDRVAQPDCTGGGRSQHFFAMQHQLAMAMAQYQHHQDLEP